MMWAIVFSLCMFIAPGQQVCRYDQVIELPDMLAGSASAPVPYEPLRGDVFCAVRAPVEISQYVKERGLGTGWFPTNWRCVKDYVPRNHA